ncbi:MAG: branched-chain amino acid ABC transporter substrate-binding protein [Mycobacteriales bacterium]
MRQRRLIKLLAATAILPVVLAACGKDNNSGGGDNKKTYTIGIMQPLTGADAALGVNEAQGAELAIDEANKKGDLPFTLKSTRFDDQGAEAQGQPVAQSVVDNKDIVAVVGPAFSGVTKAAGPVFRDAGLLFLSPSASRTNLSQQGFKTFARMVAPDSAQGPEGANYVAKGLKAKKVYAISDKSEYGQGLIDEFVKTLKTLSVSYVEEGVPAKTANYGPVISKIKSSGADVVYYGGYYSDAGLLVKQMRAAGVTAKFISGDGTNDDQFVTGAGKAAAEGAFLTCGCGDPSTDPKAASFVTAYKAKFNADPGAYSAEAYDAANAIIAAMKGLGGDVTREKLADAVLKGSYEGLTKTVKFDATGEVATRTIFVYEVKAGKRVVIGTTATLATG